MLRTVRLRVALGAYTHELRAGDCLRYRLYGPSIFAVPGRATARYLLFLV